MNTPKLNGKPYCELLTLDRIHAERCVDEGECWIWQGAMSGTKKTTPSMQFRGRVQPAYVATYLLDRGLEAVPDGLGLWRSCLNLRCIHPKHVKAGTQAQKTKFLTLAGAYKCDPSRKAKITATARSRHAKLPGGMAEAREIRASDKSQAEISKDHGISISRVNRIRNGKAWRESVIPGASIFSMGEAA